MGRGVSVGNAVEEGKVGNGVNVAKSKLNKAVGVAPIPTLGKTFGPGVMFGELRNPDENKLIRIEQRQQDASRNKDGKSILPVRPCWL